MCQRSQILRNNRPIWKHYASLVTLGNEFLCPKYLSVCGLSVCFFWLCGSFCQDRYAVQKISTRSFVPPQLSRLSYCFRTSKDLCTPPDHRCHLQSTKLCRLDYCIYVMDSVAPPSPPLIKYQIIIIFHSLK